jgi:AcrR family transcriptional regulator
VSGATGRGPGRPRDPAADTAILEATLTLLAEHGYTGLTTDAIAATAGVSKATIYRRWSSKQQVVLAAVGSLANRVPAPDTGDLRRDLTAIADGLAAVFSAPTTRRLVGALVERLLRDEEMAAALRGGFLTERRAAARTAMVRGRQRGQVRDDADLDTAIDLLAAPFYYRVLITGEPIDAKLAEGVVDVTLAYLRPPPRT